MTHPEPNPAALTVTPMAKMMRVMARPIAVAVAVTATVDLPQPLPSKYIEYRLSIKATTTTPATSGI
jgi:hypothetical protein